MKESGSIFDFRIYNNCLISNLAPHETPNIDNIEEILDDTRCYLARWTDKFGELQSGDSKQWWYLIRSGKWNISELKSHDRNEIKKGMRNFRCEIIKREKYYKELYKVYNAAEDEYSFLSSKHLSFKEFINDFRDDEIIIAAFDEEDGTLSAYSKVYYYDSHNKEKVLNLSVLKILPDKKRKSPSAALVNFICDYFLNKKAVKYICDGERAIRHITNFQKYLEKYFGFKKIYCRLNILYNKKIGLVVRVSYPFRKIVKVLSSRNKKIYNLYVLLKQEEIVRSFK